MPTTLIWPERGEWGLTSPNSRFGHNKDGFYTKAEPPFRELLIDFKAHTGTIKQWQGPTASINDIKLRWTAEGGKIIADYAVGAHRGHFEAIVLAGYELDIEFTGTAVTSVNAHPHQIIGGDYPGRDDPGPAKPGVSINCIGDLAREFDSLVAENNNTIQQWAEATITKHPGAWWAVGLAKTIYDVPVVLGQGMVDALKLGEGTGEAIWQAEDGWGVAKGVGQDALRLLQFIPAFKALKYVRAAGAEAGVLGAEVRAASAEARALNAEARSAGSAVRPPVTTVSPRPIPRAPVPQPAFLTGVDKMPRQGICTWVAMTKAYRVFKCTSLFSVHDLMKLACLDNVKIASASLRQLVPTFARLGVRLRQLGRLVPHVTEGEKIAELARAERPGAVIVFHVRWVKRVGEQLKESAHALVGFNSPQHGFCIIDRYDTPIVRSLAELERYYPSISKSFIAEAYVFEEASIKVVNQAGRLVPMIALPVSVALHAVIPTGAPSGAAAPPAAGVSGTSSAQAAPR